MGSYICAAILGSFEDLVRSYGVNPIEILKEIGILPTLLRDPDAYIHYNRYLNLLEKVALDCQHDMLLIEKSIKIFLATSDCNIKSIAPCMGAHSKITAFFKETWHYIS
jgi:hypothetical protein